jgi:hypothetical protein
MKNTQFNIIKNTFDFFMPSLKIPGKHEIKYISHKLHLSVLSLSLKYIKNFGISLSEQGE